MKNKILLLIFLMLLSACQAVKDGLTGRKHENSDEFLVEKKNALEIPPDFNTLPVPKSQKQINKSEKIEEEIELIFKKKTKSETIKSSSRSAEDYVLKKIKKN